MFSFWFRGILLFCGVFLKPFQGFIFNHFIYYAFISLVFLISLFKLFVLFSVFDLCINLKHSIEEFLKIIKEVVLWVLFPTIKGFYHNINKTIQIYPLSICGQLAHRKSISTNCGVIPKKESRCFMPDPIWTTTTKAASAKDRNTPSVNDRLHRHLKQ